MSQGKDKERKIEAGEDKITFTLGVGNHSAICGSVAAPVQAAPAEDTKARAKVVASPRT
jgi:hypothetical protein